MTLRPIDNYFLQKEEPIKSCLQFLREHILQQSLNITESWKYRMPFYSINGKMFCYIWTHKKLLHPYIGIVEGNKIHHPKLLQENRARMKILLIDPNQDIPINEIDLILKEVMSLY
jgi:Domain of unknown function (DU1801)